MTYLYFFIIYDFFLHKIALFLLANYAFCVAIFLGKSSEFCQDVSSSFPIQKKIRIKPSTGQEQPKHQEQSQPIKTPHKEDKIKTVISFLASMRRARGNGNGARVRVVLRLAAENSGRRGCTRDPL